jgi:hypothetical protein
MFKTVAGFVFCLLLGFGCTAAPTSVIEQAANSAGTGAQVSTAYFLPDYLAGAADSPMCGAKVRTIHWPSETS